MRGKYQVQRHFPQKHDASFTLCISTMLGFITLFTIILLFLWKIEKTEYPVQVPPNVPPTNEQKIGNKTENTTSTTSTNPLPSTVAIVTYESENATEQSQITSLNPEEEVEPITAQVPTCPAHPTVLPSTIATPAYNVCETNQCYKTASRMLSLLSTDVKPCDDFFSFACGGLLNNSLLMEEDLAIDVWNRIEKAIKNVSLQSPVSHQKLKNYYDGCVNYDKLMTMDERKIQGHLVLDEVGKFVDASNTSEIELTDLFIKLFQHGSKPLFDIQLDVDSTNSDKFQVIITTPNWLSSHFLTQEKKSQDCRDKSFPGKLDLNDAYDEYKICMDNFTKMTEDALNFFEVSESLDKDNSSRLTKKIIQSVGEILEELFKKPSLRRGHLHIQFSSYRNVSIAELNSDFPFIKWDRLFSTLLGVSVSDNTNVKVYQENVFHQLNETSSGEVHNMLLAIFALNLYSNIVLTHDSCNRKHYCLRVTSSLMPLVTSNLYLMTFSNDTKSELVDQVTQVHDQLKTVMDARISEAKWMDKETLNRITNKLNNMSVLLPQMFENDAVNLGLGKCELNGTNYLQDSVCLLKTFQDQLSSYYKLGPSSPVVLWSHYLTAFSTSTKFIYERNTFMIPFAVIATVCDSQLPKHVIMARLGNIIALGIGQNFDNTGLMFNSNGKQDKVLSEYSSQTYDKVKSKIKGQFEHKRTYEEDGHRYSYKLEKDEPILNERLSDITAANLSLQTILNQSDTSLPWVPFNSKQVYFLALAQTFCTKKKIPEIFVSIVEGTSLSSDRVFNIAANSEQFSQAFQCSEDSKMYFKNKTNPFPLFNKYESHPNIIH